MDALLVATPYLHGNFKLRPMISTITTVDSAYADPIQIVDIYGRSIRRVRLGKAEDEEVVLAGRLVHLEEIRGGLFAWCTRGPEHTRGGGKDPIH